jgi:hypothetical protein
LLERFDEGLPGLREAILEAEDNKFLIDILSGEMVDAESATDAFNQAI